jgi:hypothetical protein
MHNIQNYIKERLEFKINLYFKLAQQNLFYFRLFSVVAIISSALIPVVLNLDFINSNAVPLIASLLSVLVIICLGIESLFGFRQQYRNYKNSEDLLRREKYLFENQAGPYSNDGETNNKLLVERVEALILKEREDTSQKITEYKSQQTNK